MTKKQQTEGKSLGRGQQRGYKLCKGELGNPSKQGEEADFYRGVQKDTMYQTISANRLICNRIGLALEITKKGGVVGTKKLGKSAIKRKGRTGLSRC